MLRSYSKRPNFQVNLKISTKTLILALNPKNFKLKVGKSKFEVTKIEKSEFPGFNFEIFQVRISEFIISKMEFRV
ncbi:hypothetical protein JTB14_034229 [Gonioctena quinquepunctata]|nr:hypothetical protein JTB14_034229 [Gonioctena quinquepunctata]